MAKDASARGQKRRGNRLALVSGNELPIHPELDGPASLDVAGQSP